MCILCAQGTFSSALAAISVSTCSLCSAGTFGVYSGATSASQTCAACGIGSYSLSGASVCQPCQPGTASNTAGVSVCPTCSAGTYASDLGSLTCTPCSAGTYSGTTGASLASTCLACITGTYQTGTGLTDVSACTACAAGTYSTVLGAGTAGTCLFCSAGTYSSNTGASLASVCLACIAGTYQTGTGLTDASACTACSAGTYSTVVGAILAAACTSCATGTYSGTPGASLPSVCQSCVPGTYSGVSGASSAQTCQACSAGTYSTALGSGMVLGPQQVLLEFQIVYPDFMPDPFLLGNGGSVLYVAKGTTVRFYSTQGDPQLSALYLFNLLHNTPTFLEVNQVDNVLTNVIPRAASMTGTAQASYNVSVGVSGVGSSVLTWDTTDAPSNVYFLSPKLTTVFYHLTVFVASASPTTIVYAPSLISTNYIYKTLVAACLGDTVVLYKPTGVSKYTTTPFKDLFISCANLVNAGQYPALTVLASGPSPLTWVAGGIPDGMQCFVSYGSMAGLSFYNPPWYSLIRIFPRPSSPGSTGTLTSPCVSCSAGTFSTALGAPSSGACAACATGTYMTEQGGTSCTTCPASSNTNSTGKAQRGDCICDPGFVGDLAVLGQNCTTCPANSYCAGLSQTACPAHTHSPAQSSLPIHCRCDAGYRCSYRRDVSLVIRFNMDSVEFAGQSDSIKAKLASTADVPVSNVSLQYTSRIITLPPPPPPPPSAVM